MKQWLKIEDNEDVIFVNMDFIRSIAIEENIVTVQTATGEFKLKISCHSGFRSSCERLLGDNAIRLEGRL